MDREDHHFIHERGQGLDNRHEEIERQQGAGTFEKIHGVKLQLAKIICSTQKRVKCRVPDVVYKPCAQGSMTHRPSTVELLARLQVPPP